MFLNHSEHRKIASEISIFIFEIVHPFMKEDTENYLEVVCEIGLQA